MNKKIFVIWLSLLICHSTPVAAIDMNILRQMSLEELMQVKIIGSTLTDESMKTVPSAVTVFNQEQIEQIGMDYLHELLDLVPGYQSQRNAEFSTLYSYSSRGRRNGSQSKETLLLVDGRILSDPRVGSSNPMMFGLAQIERVEVIRGPGSALYGSGAYTGVINVITRKNTNELNLAVGSFNRLDAHVLATKKYNAWQFDVYAQAERDQGQSYNVDDNFNPDPSIRMNTSDPKRLNTLDLSIRYRDSLLRISHHEQQADEFYAIEMLSENFNRIKNKIYQASLEQDIQWSNNISSHLMLSWKQVEQSQNVQASAAGALAPISKPSSTDPLLGKMTLAGEYWQFKWHNDWQLNDSSSAQFGFELINTSEIEAHTASNFDLGQFIRAEYPINYYGNFDHTTQVGLLNSRRSFGIYGQYLHSFTDDTKLTLSLRYDNCSNDSRFSPRAGLVHSLNEMHTLKLLYGEAFRVPTINETDLINNPLILGNTKLTHEIVKTWDAIWLINMQQAYLSLGGFVNYYENPISTKIIGNNIRSFANTESNQAHGFELEANYQINNNWLLRGTVTHFTQLPDTAFREADTLGSLLINYRQDHWNWNLTAVYHDQREMLNGNIKQSIDSYWLFNTKLRYKFNKSWSSYAQIKNLLDKNYQTTSQGSGLIEGVPNRGREWVIGVEYRF
jgi:outer membrane receptor protein involved in Fe transport